MTDERRTIPPWLKNFPDRSERTEPPENYSLFLPTDGINTSAQWRLRDYRERGALSHSQVAKLMRDHDLDETAARDLSIQVGNALDTGSAVNLIEVNRAVAVNRAENSLRRALKYARHSQSRDLLREALKPLATDFASSDEKAVLTSAQELAADPAVALPNLLNAVERILATPGCAADMSPGDKRRVWDKRREWVVRGCCYAWRDAGKPVTYTTVSDGSKSPGQRHGKLIELIQAVVEMVTDPSTTLSGETIRKDIDRFKDDEKDPDGLLGEPIFGPR